MSDQDQHGISLLGSALEGLELELRSGFIIADVSNL